MEIRDILTWLELITYIISIIVQILIHKSDRQKEKATHDDQSKR